MEEQKVLENLAETALEDLPDEILEHIFFNLNDLISEINVSKTCRRFRNIVKERVWKRFNLFREFSMGEALDMMSPLDLEYLLQIMKDFIQTIRVDDDCLSAALRDFDDFHIDVLENVESLIFDLHEDCYPQDDEILKLTKLLPNLKYLRILTPITGCHIDKFTKLEELHLYTDKDKEYEIQDRHFRDICRNLKNLRVMDIRHYEVSSLNVSPLVYCTNLEILRVNLNPLKPVLNMVLNLPKLKVLRVLLDWDREIEAFVNFVTYDVKIHETQHFYEILDSQCERINGLAVDGFYMPLGINWDQNLKIFNYNKLQLFAFCNVTFDDRVMLEKYFQMTKLKVLCLRNWKELKNDTIIKFVKACPDLEHLDVSSCKKLNKNLIYEFLVIFKQHRRTEPLHIYYNDSGFEYEVKHENKDFWAKQKLLKFHEELLHGSDARFNYIERGYEFNFE